MDKIDVRPLVDKIKKSVEKHRLAEGSYARWLWQDSDESRELGQNPYGCADAANILYTIGEFPRQPEHRAKWVLALQGMQDAASGLYRERTHHPMHTTAHCVAALELFDARPSYPLKDLFCYLEKEQLYNLLDGLDWVNNPWPQSHQGAGIYAALVISGAADRTWENWYFDWFFEQADPDSGMWRKGYVYPKGGKPAAKLYEYMAGSFHYLFNHEYARMPLRYPEKMIDSCLEMYHDAAFSQLGREINFLEIDWSYCLNRAHRQTPHRFKECVQTLKEFAIGYIEYLNGVDQERDEAFNDLHALFGMTCALAELQQALPGTLITDRPLKLVLDRRPFI